MKVAIGGGKEGLTVHVTSVEIKTVPGLLSLVWRLVLPRILI